MSEEPKKTYPVSRSTGGGGSLEILSSVASGQTAPLEISATLAGKMPTPQELQGSLHANATIFFGPIINQASLLLQTVIVPGSKTAEGTLIRAVAAPWYDIIGLLKDNPRIAFEISPQKWEEIIAAAYKKAGFDEVTLTPRSGDHGRDVIAIKRGIGSVRVIDQVKAYKPGRLVTANDVRALMGVLQTDGAAKGFVTTTSDFAPKVRTDHLITPFIPARLQLINGTELIKRLRALAGEQ